MRQPHELAGAPFNTAGPVIVNDVYRTRLRLAHQTDSDMASGVLKGP